MLYITITLFQYIRAQFSKLLWNFIRFCVFDIYNRAEAKRRSGARNNRASKSEAEIIRIEGGMPAIVSHKI